MTIQRRADRPGRTGYLADVGKGDLHMTAVLHKLSRKTSEMSDDPLARAEHHAQEAEKLLRSWWLSSHVKGQLHATLALYYSSKHDET